MFRFFSAIVLSLLTLHYSLAQTIKVGPIKGPVCLNTELTFPITLTGSFNSSNTFTVQMRPQYSGTITSFPAVVKEESVRFLISGVSPDLSYSQQFRIVSSNPVAESEWTSSLYLSVPASVSLSPLSTDPVNPYESFPVRLTGRGSDVLTITLNDTLTLLATGSYYGSVNIDTQKELPTNRSALYTVTSVSNVCGMGQGSGSARVTLNELSLRIAGLSSKRACQGDELVLTPSIAGGTFGAENQFKVRFTNTTAPFRSVEVPAAVQNGAVRAVVPALGTFGSGQAASYTIRLLSSQPAAASPAQPLYVYDAPSVVFSSNSPTVDVGSFVNFGLAFSGIPPFDATISDGSHVRGIDQYLGSGSVMPTQTTSYSIVALQTGCATPTSRLPADKLLVTIRPSIRIDSVSASPYCEGSRQWVVISSNVNLSASTQYQVQFYNSETAFVGPLIPATRTGNRLEFIVKTDTPASYQHFMQLRVSATDRGATYTTAPQSGAGLYVMRTPRITITQPRPQTASFGSYVSVPVRFEGGGPYTITLSDGTQLTERFQGANPESWFKAPALLSGQYSIRAVSNACFSGTGVNSFSLVVTGTPAVGLYISDPPSILESGWRCPSDSLKLTVKTVGTFAPDNVFTVQVQQDGQSSWITLPLTVTPGNPVAIAQQSGYRSYRFASTNPVAFSDSRYVSVANPPVIGFNSYSWPAQPVMGTSQLLMATIRQGIPPFTVVYSRNDETVTRQVGGDTMNESVVINTPTTFTIKSIRDVCGAGSIATGTAGPASLTATPVALRLRVLQSHLEGGDNLPCAGNQVLIPFLIEGKTTANTRYSLQIAQPDSAFRTVGTPVSQSPFWLTIPSSTTSSLKLRIVASNPDVVGESAILPVYRTPTARLTTDSGTDQLLTDNSPVNLRVQLTTSTGSSSLVFSDGFTANVYGTSYDRQVFPRRRQTYSLRSVANGCGYGLVAGQVTVAVKPSLAAQVPALACSGSPLSLTYVGRGEFGASNQFRFVLLSSDGKTRLTIDSSQTLADVRVLRLPTLTPGSYQLQVITTDPSVSQTLPLRVTGPVRLSLSGNTVINPDQSTRLAIRAGYQGTGAGVPADPVSFTLSDGTTQIADWSYLYSNTLLVTVMPRQTTTYTITAVQNLCGAGQVAGQAVVTVNPVTTTRLTTTDPSGDLQRALCTGDTIRVGYTLTGALPTNARLTVQLSDSTGRNFADVPTVVGTGDLLRAALAVSLPPGTGYRVRVAADNAAVSAGAYVNPLRLVPPPTAQFITAQLIYQPGATVRIPVRLGGEGPWNYQVQTDVSSLNRYAYVANDTILVQPISPSVTFQLKRVSNGWCSRGLIMEPAQLRLELVTEMESPLALVEVAPNPTSDLVYIRWQTGRIQPMSIRLSTLSGATLLARPGQSIVDSVSLGRLPTGIYLLQLSQGAQQQTVRIVKQ